MNIVHRTFAPSPELNEVSSRALIHGTRKVIKSSRRASMYGYFFLQLVALALLLLTLCRPLSLPAVKLAAVKYGVLTSDLRYTNLSTRETRDPGRGRDDLVTLSRTGDLASVRRVTFVLTYSIYTSWAYLLFIVPIQVRSLVPPPRRRFPSDYPRRRVNLRDIQKFSCG